MLATLVNICCVLVVTEASLRSEKQQPRPFLSPSGCEGHIREAAEVLLKVRARAVERHCMQMILFTLVSSFIENSLILFVKNMYIHS